MESTTDETRQKRRERWMFLFLSFVLWPAVAIALVGGWGLVVWISQWFFGPPGPL